LRFRYGEGQAYMVEENGASTLIHQRSSQYMKEVENVRNG